MNAPAAKALDVAAAIDTPDYRIVKIGELSPSPTNPRSRRGFDADSLNELAQTMKPPIGIIEPLVVREIAKQPAAKPAFSWPFPTPMHSAAASGGAQRAQEERRAA